MSNEFAGTIVFTTPDVTLARALVTQRFFDRDLRLGLDRDPLQREIDPRGADTGHVVQPPLHRRDASGAVDRRQRELKRRGPGRRGCARGARATT